MNVMTLLMERIDDELQDACDYAKLALEYRDMEPELAVLFARLSEEEMTHMNLLHGAAVEQIERIRRQGGTVPEAMAAVYEYLHKRQIDKAEGVKRYQSMFRRAQ